MITHTHKKTTKTNKQLVGWLVYGVQRHFQQYFSYIVVVSFIGGGKNHRPVASH
jgi:hypothetical protein